MTDSVAGIVRELSPELRARMRKACSEATQGRWMQYFARFPIEGNNGERLMAICAHAPLYLERDPKAIDMVGKDMEFMELASPENIAALLDERDALAAALSHMGAVAHDPAQD